MRAGIDTISGIDPFIMQADGKGWIFAPNGLAGRPAAHALRAAGIGDRESALRAAVQSARGWSGSGRTIRITGRGTIPSFPYVLTTYRLTEHHTAGGMTRWLSWLSELQPEMFCEVSPELAAEKGLTNGGWATITHGARARSRRACW